MCAGMLNLLFVFAFAFHWFWGGFGWKVPVEGFGGRFRWKVSVEGFGGRFRMGFGGGITCTCTLLCTWYVRFALVACPYTYTRHLTVQTFYFHLSIVDGCWAILSQLTCPCAFIGSLLELLPVHYMVCCASHSSVAHD